MPQSHTAGQSTAPRERDTENQLPHGSKKTIKVKQPALSSPARKNTKTRTKHKSPTHNESNNKQWINNNKTTALERTAAEVHNTGTKAQNWLARFLTYAMYHYKQWMKQRKGLMTHRLWDSQSFKENLKCPAKDKHQAPTHQWVLRHSLRADQLDGFMSIHLGKIDSITIKEVKRGCILETKVMQIFFSGNISLPTHWKCIAV